MTNSKKKLLRGFVFTSTGMVVLLLLLYKKILIYMNDKTEVNFFLKILGIFEVTFGKTLLFVVFSLIFFGLVQIYTTKSKIKVDKGKLYAYITLFLSMSLYYTKKYIGVQLSKDFFEAGRQLLEIGFNTGKYPQSGGLIGSFLAFPFYQIIHIKLISTILLVLITVSVLFLFKDFILFGVWLLVALAKYYKSDDYKKKLKILRAKKIVEKKEQKDFKNAHREQMKEKIIESRKKKLSFELAKKIDPENSGNKELYNKKELEKKEREWLEYLDSVEREKILRNEEKKAAKENARLEDNDTEESLNEKYETFKKESQLQPKANGNGVIKISDLKELDVQNVQNTKFNNNDQGKEFFEDYPERSSKNLDLEYAKYPDYGTYEQEQDYDTEIPDMTGENTVDTTEDAGEDFENPYVTSYFNIANPARHNNHDEYETYVPEIPSVDEFSREENSYKNHGNDDKNDGYDEYDAYAGAEKAGNDSPFEFPEFNPVFSGDSVEKSSGVNEKTNVSNFENINIEKPVIKSDSNGNYGGFSNNKGPYSNNFDTSVHGGTPDHMLHDISIDDIFVETEPDESKRKEIETQILENVGHLELVLKEFGIDAKVVDYQRGPTITRYEITIPKGIRVSRVTALADDIAMNLSAESIRIEAPIPGKNTIGIETPNRVKEPVYFSNLIRSEELKGKDSLKIILGKNIVGKDKIIDIAKMPHLLIAGQTGSGKSVAVNTLVASLITKKSHKEVKFIMVDPKMVELMPFNGIPHLLLPVIIDPKQASIALKWAVIEMENRYRTLMEAGVRNIKSYNELPRVEKMPYIVIIIDELADLMLVAASSVEESIARIAQKARAIGIHLVVATQRPSTDVITGMIKANLPSRISFALRSQIDSRTILDTPGAEKLLGKGDMLLLESGSSKLERIQGAFISDEEVHKLTNQLRANYKTEYKEDILTELESDIEKDELFDEAVEVVRQEGKVSISLVQRKLKIGFNRASRICEQLMEYGIISEDKQVLLDEDE